VKSKRHMKIVELVSQNVITSQQALCEALAREGIKVTQATVSRDIKELNLVRVPSGDGRYKYSLLPGDPSHVYRDRFGRLFRESCLDIDKSGNLVLVKTLSGAASAVGEAIDNLKIQDVIGTVAGDDVVLVVVADNASPEGVMKTLREMAGL
jgi:transcriptional regulator of arginine metabolism